MSHSMHQPPVRQHQNEDASQLTKQAESDTTRIWV
jgi:hypothetical protein